MTILGDSIAWAVPELRVEAESIMSDYATITRAGGRPVLDEATGLMIPTPDVHVWEGPCRLRMPETVEMNVLFGERQVTTTRYVVCVPWTVASVRVGDVVAVESSDPVAAARVFRVVATSAETLPVQRRLGVEAVE